MRRRGYPRSDRRQGSLCEDWQRDCKRSEPGATLLTRWWRPALRTAVERPSSLNGACRVPQNFAPWCSPAPHLTRRAVGELSSQSGERRGKVETQAEVLRRLIADRHRRLRDGVDADAAQMILHEIEQARTELERIERAGA
jgi:hypothetical protein